MFKRLATILLLLTITTLGSGALEYAHNLSHLYQQQWIESVRNPHHIPPADKKNPTDQNCWLHMQLHLPIISVAAVQMLVLAGILIAFLTQIPTVRPAFAVHRRIDCRGPPR